MLKIKKFIRLFSIILISLITLISLTTNGNLLILGLPIPIFNHNIAEADQDDVPHKTHLTEDRGPRLGTNCAVCHDNPYPGYLNDHNTLANTNVCNECHSQDGTFDGVNNPEVGAKNNWCKDVSSIYEPDADFRPGKEKWCIGCHDEKGSAIQGVSAANIAGMSMTGDWQSPDQISSSDLAGAANLIDSNLETGNTGKGGSWIIFDLGEVLNVSHLRLYSGYYADTRWKVEGSTDLADWTRVVLGQSMIFAAPTWQVGPQDGWHEVRLDKFIPMRYIRLGKINPWPLIINSLREFEYKRDLQYGYYVNGHKFACHYCHNTASVHIDGLDQTYQASQNNYQVGYRLNNIELDDQIVPPMEIPRVGCNSGEAPRTSNDFALCFLCHDKYKLLGDAGGSGLFKKSPAETNFRNDTHADLNEHLRHLRGRLYCGNGFDWDSDWDGALDSPQSCPACHNVHGSPSPAMTRHGELTSPTGTLNKSPMLNLQYFNADQNLDPDLQKVMESTGAKTQFYGPGPGWVGKNNTCNMCHNDQITYFRQPVSVCQDCHSDYVENHPGHIAHLQSAWGPKATCWDCHAGSQETGHSLQLADGRSLAETSVCDPCHSPEGAYDGINDPVIGAKPNWNNGVYENNNLKTGKERWCVGCHDHGTSVIKGISAPNVGGDGTTYGYYVNGHLKVLCSDCHDLTIDHIDGEARTYKFSTIQYQADKSGISYAAGYRLKYINSQVPMMIPSTYSTTFSSNKDKVKNNAFRLCFNASCHDSARILDQTTVDGISTNFSVATPQPPRNYSFVYNTSYSLNEHYKHLLDNMILTWPWADSDWDTSTTGQGPGNGIDSLITCVTCHNVHGASGTCGATNEAMIRDGSLVGRIGFGFSYLIKNSAYPKVTSQGATRENSVGAIFRNITNSNMCFLSCHGGAKSQPNIAYNADNTKGTFLEYYRRY